MSFYVTKLIKSIQKALKMNNLAEFHNLTQLEESYKNRTGRQKGKLKVLDENPLTAICYISNYIHQLVSVKDVLRPESV